MTHTNITCNFWITQISPEKLSNYGIITGNEGIGINSTDPGKGYPKLHWLTLLMQGGGHFGLFFGSLTTENNIRSHKKVMIMADKENDNNKLQNNQFRKENLTGKAEESEPAIEQTESERDNKGADQTRPDLTEQREELRHTNESRKHSH